MADGWSLHFLLERNNFIVVACLYGISGVSAVGSSDYDTNERLLATASARAAQFLDTPYYLLGDFNVSAKDSCILDRAIKLGFLYDLAK